MKLALVFVGLLSCSLGKVIELNRPASFEQNDWVDIKPRNVFVEPNNPIPQTTASRVVGGTQATRNSIPYQTALVVNSGFFCGASLISSNWVLTAAHCVEDAVRIQTVFGAHNIFQLEMSQVAIWASSVNIHNGYNADTQQNDIALLSLESSVTFSNVVQPVALAPNNGEDYVGTVGLLSGWGRTNDASNAVSPVLQKVNLSIISNAACQAIYGSTIQSNHLCTSGVGGVGGCHGDSGGPLVVNSLQVGVVSFGSSICSAGNPTAFARVSHFRSWISEVTGV